jgi:hypothetical protein
MAREQGRTMMAYSPGAGVPYGVPYAYSKTPGPARLAMLSNASEGLAKIVNSAFGTALSGPGISDAVKSHAGDGQVDPHGISAKPVGNEVKGQPGNDGASQLRMLAPHGDLTSPKMRAPVDKWNGTLSNYQKAQTPRNLARLRMASRNLSHDLADGGVQVSPEALMQVVAPPLTIQGPGNRPDL